MKKRLIAKVKKLIKRKQSGNMSKKNHFKI